MEQRILEVIRDHGGKIDFEGKRIDSVFFDRRMTVEQVYRSLTEHDGYPHEIIVWTADKIEEK